MSKISNSLRLGGVAAALVSAAVVSAGVASSAAQAAPAPVAASAHAVAAKPVLNHPIACTVKKAKKWTACTGDNVAVARAHRVYLTLNSSAHRPVQFRVLDHRTHRVLAQPVTALRPNHRPHLYWINRTDHSVSIDVEARTTGKAKVKASLTVR